MDEQKSVKQCTQSEQSPGPQTIEEAQCAYQGYIAGLTAYAREKGDSTLKRDNEILRRLMDQAGWETIEKLEAIAAKARCEHGIPEGEFCEPCNKAYKAAMADPDNDVSQPEQTGGGA